MDIKATIDDIAKTNKLRLAVECMKAVALYIEHGLQMGGFMTRLLNDYPKEELVASMHPMIKDDVDDYITLMKELKLVYGDKLDNARK